MNKFLRKLKTADYLITGVEVSENVIINWDLKRLYMCVEYYEILHCYYYSAVCYPTCVGGHQYSDVLISVFHLNIFNNYIFHKIFFLFTVQNQFWLDPFSEVRLNFFIVDGVLLSSMSSYRRKNVPTSKCCCA